eukprot:CAMPEP_0194149292 /NCGR_PEP_ID=MMETSP0152-20130528/37150_1 /TAXON_ID=1049557 /ORGANISM="Thalassiothrix antarctica, Strain L6-D1" /LENGTH=184 /DNA_ID=CAMNT_0038851363 /DNA_START=86 /DNA_END=640 /DNA_ORIENTATION=-
MKLSILALVLVAFAIGIIVGNLNQGIGGDSSGEIENSSSNGGQQQQQVSLDSKRYSLSSEKDTIKGIILELADVPFRNTSHIDDEGRPIMKQQFIEPFAISNFVGFSVATFQPGQIMMPPHEHRSLHEFFYVIEGNGIIQKDGIDHEVKSGTFLHMAPHEKHGIYVPKNATKEMKMIVCGITVD